MKKLLLFIFSSVVGIVVFNALTILIRITPSIESVGQVLGLIFLYGYLVCLSGVLIYSSIILIKNEI